MNLDIEANRRMRKWTRREKTARVLWTLVRPLFTLSPRPFWAWRRMMLRAFGARIGASVHVYPSALISIPWNLDLGTYAAVGDRAILYALGSIRIGARVTISQGAHLCAGTHNWRDPALPLMKPPIHIGDDVWICADAFIGPGVTIGDKAIIGARAVVMKDVASMTIVAGNPAKKIGERDT